MVGRGGRTGDQLVVHSACLVTPVSSGDTILNYCQVVPGLRTETGTQLVLTAATAPWYPFTHAKSSPKSGVPWGLLEKG